MFLFKGILVLTLIFGLILSSCQENEIEYGLLTIKNLPDVEIAYEGFIGEAYWYVGVLYNPDKIESQLDVHNWSFGNGVASNDDGSNRPSKGLSPFKMMSSKAEFLDSTRTYMVHIQPSHKSYETYRAIMLDVTFIKGNATIDYNDMTPYYSLPYSK